MALLTLTQDNTRPRVNFTLRNDAGAAIDLTDATLQFSLTPIGDTTPKFTNSATIASAVAGTCYYDWQVGDLDTAGHYHGQIKVTFSDGDIQSTNFMGFYVQPTITG